jgi:hypothetical protein
MSVDKRTGNMLEIRPGDVVWVFIDWVRGGYPIQITRITPTGIMRTSRSSISFRPNGTLYMPLVSYINRPVELYKLHGWWDSRDLLQRDGPERIMGLYVEGVDDGPECLEKLNASRIAYLKEVEEDEVDTAAQWDVRRYTDEMDTCDKIVFMRELNDFCQRHPIVQSHTQNMSSLEHFRVATNNRLWMKAIQIIKDETNVDQRAMMEVSLVRELRSMRDRLKQIQNLFPSEEKQKHY